MYPFSKKKIKTFKIQNMSIYKLLHITVLHTYLYTQLDIQNNDKTCVKKFVITWPKQKQTTVKNQNKLKKRVTLASHHYKHNKESFTIKAPVCRKWQEFAPFWTPNGKSFLSSILWGAQNKIASNDGKSL